MIETGLFGGTFDPPHIGHLEIARRLRDLGWFDAFYFVPCFQPVHKSSGEDLKATVKAKLAMLESAVADEPGFEIERCELERGGPSYMVDTLEELEQRYNSVSKTRRFYLVMGSDSLLNFHTWHCFLRILELTHLVVIQRPGFIIKDGGKLDNRLSKCMVESFSKLNEMLAGGIYLSSIQMPDISSTDIRQRVAQGLGIHHLVPDCIEKMVQSANHYHH